MRQKMIQIPNSVVIHPTARIDVQDGCIGERTIIEANVSIEGRYVSIGRESWIGNNASIGGGSCYDEEAFLKAGDWFHLGPYAHVNTARGVKIGDEVGIGWRSSVFTHGAYESVLDGFPVQWDGISIGNRVWIPNAWINPGVRIGNDVVVSAMSLVNHDLPDGCLAGGVPAKVLKENAYPNIPDQEVIDKLYRQLTNKLAYHELKCSVGFDGKILVLYYDSQVTIFDIPKRIIDGNVNNASLIVKEQLRRNGIRFKCHEKYGVYVKW